MFNQLIFNIFDCFTPIHGPHCCDIFLVIFSPVWQAVVYDKSQVSSFVSRLWISQILFSFRTYS